MTTTDKIDTRISELSSKLDKLIGSESEPSSDKTSTTYGNFLSNAKGFITSPKIIYVLIPLGFLCLLLYCKPSFLYEEVSEDGEYPVPKLIYKKLFLSVFIGSLLVFGGIYYYNNKD